MTNTNIEEINSVCTTSRELISSSDFTRGLEIILGQVKIFNKDYILGLFTKLQNDEVLDEEEKNDLLKFVSDDKVSKSGQEILSKLSNVSVNVKTNNSNEFNSFSSLLNDIFATDGYDGYKKIQKHIGEVAGITELTLNAYEGMRRLQIKINGETREIYLDNENLRVDSSNWEVKKKGSDNVKINPEGDIIEFLDGEEKGEQLFNNIKAAEREAKKLGKRLAFTHDENNEFQAIIDEVGVEEFMKVFPGFRTEDGISFWGRGKLACFCSASTDLRGKAFNIEFYRGGSRVRFNWEDRYRGCSVRLVKD